MVVKITVKKKKLEITTNKELQKLRKIYNSTNKTYLNLVVKLSLWIYNKNNGN